MSEMNNMEQGKEIQDKVQQALSEAINEADGGMVLKWVTVAEILDGEGNRILGTFVSDEARRWDIFGLLEEVRMFQQAHMVAEIIEDHRE
jgi:hypothetical protein